MRKINLKDFFMGALVSGLIFCGIGVAAITLTASEIKYTPSNEISTATNAEDAIDELYTMTKDLTKGELTLVGTTNSFNIADIVGAENIGKYSKKDFVVCDNVSTLTSSLVSGFNNSIAFHIRYKYTLTKDFNLSYDNSNGNVSITNKVITITTNFQDVNTGADYGSRSTTFSIPPKVYLYM